MNNSSSEPSIETWPHKTVLYHEVTAILRPHQGGKYLDATLGAGGHSFSILSESAPDGLLLGIDRDAQAIKIAQKRLERFGKRVFLKNTSFIQMEELAREIGWRFIDGIIFDLGLSSMQLETPGRGFSFLKDEPLDMRFDQQNGITAAEIINNEKEAELSRVIWEYGEEPKARQIAAAICRARPLESTAELARLVSAIYHAPRGHIHPATKTFQALRMAVNQELFALQSGLEQALHLLVCGGRMAMISFHSLEDRLVKQFIRHESKDCICPPEQPICTCGHKATLKILTRHVITPSEDEILINPRARSAHLRAAEKII
jgi:16S rRNA (cytosine1402-N4)-methyltransferase